MELRRLPFDIAQQIWSTLPIIEQARLYATFDRSIHRTLLKVTRVAGDLYQVGKEPYVRTFLSQLRDVVELRDDSERTSVFQNSLLAALNPLEVSLYYLPLHLSPLSSEKASLAERQGPLLDCLSNLDLATLFPRLHTLSLDVGIPNARQLLRHKTSNNGGLADFVSFPSTLTSLSIAFSEGSLVDVLDVLPPTLLHLDISLQGGLMPLPPLFARLPLLTSLTSYDQLAPLENGATLPPALTNLNLSSFSKFPSDFFNSFVATSLRTFTIQYVLLPRHSSQFDFGTPLQSVKDLSVKFRFNYQQPNIFEVHSLPIGLTRLTFALPHHSRQFGLPIASLHSLTYLKLENQRFGHKIHLRSSKTDTEIEPDLPPPKMKRYPLSFDILRLPKNLITLVLESPIASATNGAIVDFPRSLVSLSTPKIHLNIATELCAARPHLYLSLSRPIKLWDSINGKQLQADLHNLWSPVLDIQAFEHAAASYYYAQRIILPSLNTRINTDPDNATQGNFPEIKTLMTRPQALAEQFSHLKAFPYPQFIEVAFFQLERMVMWLPTDTSMNFRASQLPSTLTDLDIRNIHLIGDELDVIHKLVRISSNGTFSENTPLFIDDMVVTHLDAPLWQIMMSDEEAFQKRHITCTATLTLAHRVEPLPSQLEDSTDDSSYVDACIVS